MLQSGGGGGGGGGGGVAVWWWWCCSLVVVVVVVVAVVLRWSGFILSTQANTQPAVSLVDQVRVRNITCFQNGFWAFHVRTRRSAATVAATAL